MSTKSILFDVNNVGSFDGVTQFSLPSPLPAPDANGQIVIPITAASGIIDPDSLSNLFGVNGYWLRTLAIDNNNVGVIRAMIGLQQPKPSIAVGGNAITHPLVHLNTNGNVNAVRPFLEGKFIPPGWLICLFFDDNAGTPVVGPYQVLMEFESTPQPEDAARAVQASSFAYAPTTIV